MGTVIGDINKIMQAFAGATSITSLFVDRAAGEDPGRIVLVHPTGQELYLPGIVQRIWLGGQKHDYEGVPIEGRSGEVKLYHGETSSEIYVESWLLDDDETTLGEDISQWLTLNLGDAYRRAKECMDKTKMPTTALEKLAMLNSIFHARDEFTMTPLVWGIKNPHINVRCGNDAKVLFEEMPSEEVAGKSILKVNIKFIEYELAITILELGEKSAVA